MEPVMLMLMASLFVPGTCEEATPNCLWETCCETVGQSCVIQPQGLHCEQQGELIRCFDMGNSGCVRYFYGGFRG